MTHQLSQAAFERAASALGLAVRETDLFTAVYQPVARWISDTLAERSRPLFVGVNGAQGSGKSTFCALLSAALRGGGELNVVTLSIDDVYLTRSERVALGTSTHPLCAIRGVPGTHDLALTHGVFDALMSAGEGQSVAIPRFDKALDDRAPRTSWDHVEGPLDVVFFEGWCVGCPELPPWTGPYTAREAREDPDGTWARWSESHLADSYQQLFARLDATIMIRVPSMETVRQGRWLQEQKLWQRHAKTPTEEHNLVGLMTYDEVLDYVALFARHTEHMLEHLPARADVLISRDENFSYRLEHLKSKGRAG